jgi:hypothetical protein
MFESIQIAYKAFMTMKPEFYFDMVSGIIWGIAGGLLSAYVAKKKGYPYKIWFLIGFLTRIYGLIAIAGIPAQTKEDKL